MSIALRVVLTVMCATFTFCGLVTWSQTLSGIGAGLGIALLASIVELRLRNRWSVKP